MNIFTLTPIFHTMPRQKKLEKSHITKNAMKLFWKKGYHQTSVQDLVDQIGINRASLYEMYDGKEGIFKESFLHYTNKVNKKINLIFSNCKSVKSGFDDFINFVVEDLLKNSNGCLISNSYAELLPTESNISKTLVQTRNIWVSQILHILNVAKKNNELIDSNCDLESISNALYMSITGICTISKTKVDKRNLKFTLDLFKNKILFK